MKPWLVTFLRRLFGWTENGCETTSPSARPRVQYRRGTAEGRAAFTSDAIPSRKHGVKPDEGIHELEMSSIV